MEGWAGVPVAAEQGGSAAEGEGAKVVAVAPRPDEGTLGHGRAGFDDRDEYGQGGHEKEEEELRRLHSGARGLPCG